MHIQWDAMYILQYGIFFRQTQMHASGVASGMYLRLRHNALSYATNLEKTVPLGDPVKSTRWCVPVHLYRSSGMQYGESGTTAGMIHMSKSLSLTPHHIEPSPQDG